MPDITSAEPRSGEADPIVRVMAQHSPTLFGLLGLWPLSQCAPVLVVGDRSYYRSASTPRWVLYKRSVRGHGQSDGSAVIFDQPEAPEGV